MHTMSKVRDIMKAGRLKLMKIELWKRDQFMGYSLAGRGYRVTNPNTNKLITHDKDPKSLLFSRECHFEATGLPSYLYLAILRYNRAMAAPNITA